jgi:PAS domain S-box-containing protein
MIDTDEVLRFTTRLQTARTKAALRLRDSVSVPTSGLEALLGELDETWEELLVAEEELRHQTDELVSSQSALALERERYQWLFEFAPDPYVVTNRQGIVRNANRAALGLLSATARFVLGKPLIIFVPRDRRGGFRSALARVPQVERLTDWDLELQPRQGAPFVVALTVAAMPAPATGELELLWSMRDMRDRHRMDAERRALADEIAAEREAAREEQQRREQAEESDRAKDAFLSMISHELRAPLTALIGWVHLLAQGPLDASGRARAIEVIERTTQAQVKLIDDLLDVSRMLSGQLRLEREAFDLAPALSATVEMMRPAAEQAGLWLDFHAAAEALPVIGDTDRLRQVLLNLLSNSMKFTTTGGRIEVAVSREGGHVQVSVTDSGMGIAPEFLPRVFDRFSQADSGSKRRHGGLGLGLAIARYLVERHGGTIRAESDGRGRGARFFFRLPLADA